MKYIPAAVLTLSLLVLALPGQAAEGMKIVASEHSVATTADRIVSAVKAKGMHVFARIDHAAGAEKAGLTLPPTQLVIFGNPKVGTRLMQCDRSVAIDLPMKMLVWKNGEGVHIGYNTPAYLAERHGLDDCKDTLEKIEQALSGFALKAAH